MKLYFQQINCQEAILHITKGSIYREYCIVYNQSWTHLAESLDAAVSFHIVLCVFYNLIKVSQSD